PFVGHGDDVGVVEMLPLSVATMLAFVGWWRTTRVAFDPLADVVIEELSGPDHAGERLSLDVARVSIGVIRLQGFVELIRLAQTRGKDGIKINEGLRDCGFAKAQSHTR